MGGEGAAGRVAPRVRLRRVHARAELSQKGEIPSVQRKIIDAFAVDHLADGSVLGFEYRGAGRYLHRLRHLARFEYEINYHGGTDVDRDVLLLRGLESLGGSTKLVASDSDR